MQHGKKSSTQGQADRRRQADSGSAGPAFWPVFGAPVKSPFGRAKQKLQDQGVSNPGEFAPYPLFLEQEQY
jgi:hypothetical protein